MAGNPKSTANRWARLSVGYYRDPKIIEVGPLAEAAFLRLLALAREVIESADVDGAVPYLLAARELRDITDLFAVVTPGGTFEGLLTLLADVSLIQVEEKTIIVSSYTDWQTTRSEIDSARLGNRNRVAAFRQRKAGLEVPADGVDEAVGQEEEDMGVYDTPVTAFADLRDGGSIKKGNRKIGKHGLNPGQVADAERIIDHLSAVRKETLGTGFRVTPTWWTDVKRLLSGSGDSAPYTADQVCDLIDFTLHNHFWHSHCQTPAGLVKHSPKIYTSDDFIRWSKSNNRPEANRPRNSLAGQAGPANFRGALAADKKVDWSNITEEM